MDATLARTDIPTATDRGPLDASVDVVMDVRQPCRASTECAGDPAGAVCDTATGRCIECLAASDTCPASRHCDDATHSCMDGCRSDEGCANVRIDAGVDGAVSVATARCDTASHTCVACVTDAHCPPGTLCMGHACVPGCDEDHGCAEGDTCCLGGCVDTRTNTGNCGACGQTCSAANGTAACVGGACAVGACNAGYGDCDGNAANGCETTTTNDTVHCGACNRACVPPPNADAVCAGGTCNVTCTGTFRDCDGAPTNGCETDTSGDTNHCGACGRACAPGLVCDFGTCQALICCAELRARLPMLPSGVYPLAVGDGTTYPAYCDMTSEGGGWTLVMMVPDAPSGTFGFDVDAWTDAQTINPEVTDPARNVPMRSQGFYRVPVLSEMKFCVGSLTSCMYELRFGASTQSVFLGDETTVMRPATDFAPWGYAGTFGCNRAGFNVRVPGGSARCRYGILVNRTGTCGGMEDGAIGFGCVGHRGTLVSAGRSDGVTTRHDRGWIFVR